MQWTIIRPGGLKSEVLAAVDKAQLYGEPKLDVFQL